MNKILFLTLLLLPFTSQGIDDLEKACAVDLCGNPGSKPSAWVSESTIGDYVIPGTMERFPEIETAINRKVSEQVRSNQVLIALLKSRTSNLGEFLSFSAWTEDHYSLFAKKFYYPHFHILKDLSKPLSERFTLQMDVPESASEVFKSGLRSFAESQLRNMKSGATKEKVCDLNCRAGLREKILSVDIKKVIKRFENSNDFDKSLASVKKLCRGNLVIAGLKPSNTHVFTQEFPLIKEQFIQTVAGKFTEESKIAIKHFFDELRLVFNDGGSVNAVDKFIQRMNYPPSPYEVPDFSHLTNQEILLKLVQSTEAMPYDIGSHICRPTPAYLIWDSFNPIKKNQLSVSLFSTSHPAYGKGLISHELGHALSFMFQENMLSPEDEVHFNKIRTCATKSYKIPVIGTSALSRLDDHKRTEEDNADLISYMANPDPSANFGCSMLQIDEQMNYVKPSLRSENSTDVHSTPLLRALREAIYKGKKIPESCKSLMEQEKKYFLFDKCF